MVSFGFELGDAKRVLDLLCCWTGLPVKKDKLPIWSPIPSCFMWIIWRKKNLFVFEDKESLFLHLKSQPVGTFFDT